MCPSFQTDGERRRPVANRPSSSRFSILPPTVPISVDQPIAVLLKQLIEIHCDNDNDDDRNDDNRDDDDVNDNVNDDDVEVDQFCRSIGPLVRQLAISRRYCSRGRRSAIFQSIFQ